MGKITLEEVKMLALKQTGAGIGTLSEKTLHATLKNYFEPNPDLQEVLIGKYVADIFQNGEIMEIQTRQLGKMRPKLDFFLPNYEVTVIHPVACEKMLYKIDETTGEVLTPRKSPKKGTKYHAFQEFYKIKMYLKDPNIRLKIVLLNMDEYRVPNKRKRRHRNSTERFDQVPTAILQEIDIITPADYDQFLPENLTEPFTTADFAKEAKINRSLAQIVVHILAYMGRIEKIGTQNRSNLYIISK